MSPVNFGEKVSSQSIPVEINLEEKADPQKLNFDVNEVNCSIFELVQQSLRSVVAKYTANGHTAFMLAAGDSAVTPHYFAGLGISSGMNMVDNILENIVKFDRDQLQEEDLVKKINDGAGVVTEQALENGQEFVTPLEDEEKKRIAEQKMHFEFVKMMKINTKQMYEFEIQKPSFKLLFSQKNIGFKIIAGENTFYAKITPEGLIEARRSETEAPAIFFTILHAVKNFS
uniref:Uncharacterized protein n=1 Tax=Ditylenchus dipsaci TaxID=166011 RepID=A0A915D1R0_9BILA